ncbi:MAG: DUF805 domain-containing protein [Phycisphaerae bacterium]
MMIFDSIKSTALSCAKMLKKTYVFKGRASIEEFSLFALLSMMIFSLLKAGEESIGVSLESHINAETYSLLYGVCFALISIPVIAAWVRRLHDTGKSGNFLWLILIPVIGHLVVLFMTIKKSQPQDNKYGPCLPI